MKFSDFRKQLDEAIRDEIPAPMLVLRRRGIRIFPDGRKVALYTNDKYNLVFTVPYGSNVDDAPITGFPNG